MNKTGAETSWAKQLKTVCKWTQKDRGARLKAEAKKIKVEKAATAVPDRSTGRRSTTNCGFGSDEHLGRHADARSSPVARHSSRPRIHRPPKPPSYPRRLTRGGGRPYIGYLGSIGISSEMVQAGSTPVAAGSSSTSQVAYQQPIEVVTSQTVCLTSMGCWLPSAGAVCGQAHRSVSRSEHCMPRARGDQDEMRMYACHTLPQRYYRLAKTATYCLFAENASLRKPRTLSGLDLNTGGC